MRSGSLAKSPPRVRDLPNCLRRWPADWVLEAVAREIASRVNLPTAPLCAEPRDAQSDPCSDEADTERTQQPDNGRSSEVVDRVVEQRHLQGISGR